MGVGSISLLKLLLVWALFAGIVGIYARRKGHSGIIMFVVSLVFSAPVGFLIELARTPKEAVARTKKCPACAELIKPEATVCRYCGEDIPVLENRAYKESIEEDWEK